MVVENPFAFFGRYQFPSITNRMVDEYKRNRLADGVKHSTINKELAALSSFCRWAEDQGYCERIQIRRFPPKLTRAPMMDVPSRSEMVRLLRSIPRKKRGIFAAMYYLGLRSQEARDLVANDVNWLRRILIITGKGNKQRVLPINRRVAPYLRNLPFPAPKDLRDILFWACKRAGVQRKVNPHLFRHAFGLHMTASGVGLRALQEIMGHSTSLVTERYSQVVAETLRKEMDKF
ncbi:MAG: tyrosine-type recombinase/integrase [bacterium]|nr:tyrosine-type recombinase/integrase [bacterium]